MKPLIWVGDSREVVRDFPDDPRQEAGFQLWRVQCGMEPDDWKPVPDIGAGVKELRIRTELERQASRPDGAGASTPPCDPALAP